LLIDIWGNDRPQAEKSIQSLVVAGWQAETNILGELGASEAAIAKARYRDAHCRQLPLWRDRVRGCAVFSDSPAF
jgi:hypothetical protein